MHILFTMYVLHARSKAFRALYNAISNATKSPRSVLFVFFCSRETFSKTHRTVYKCEILSECFFDKHEPLPLYSPPFILLKPFWPSSHISFVHWKDEKKFSFVIHRLRAQLETKYFIHSSSKVQINMRGGGEHSSAHFNANFFRIFSNFFSFCVKKDQFFLFFLFKILNRKNQKWMNGAISEVILNLAAVCRLTGSRILMEN